MYSNLQKSCLLTVELDRRFDDLHAKRQFWKAGRTESYKNLNSHIYFLRLANHAHNDTDLRPMGLILESYPPTPKSISSLHDPPPALKMRHEQHRPLQVVFQAPFPSQAHAVCQAPRAS